MKSFDSFNTREKEKECISHLERLWASKPQAQRTEIEEIVERSQKDGVLVTIYNFLEAPSVV